jgi:hypothetical protein
MNKREFTGELLPYTAVELRSPTPGHLQDREPENPFVWCSPGWEAQEPRVTMMTMTLGEVVGLPIPVLESQGQTPGVLLSEAWSEARSSPEDKV